MSLKRLAIICLFLLAGPYAAHAEQAPTITIKASQSTGQDGATRYEYRVVNSGPHRIAAVDIGYDYYHGVFELLVVPKGWSFDGGLAQGSATSPPGWHVNVVTEEQSPFIEIEWRVNDLTTDTEPGRTLAGFSIITAEPDDKYLHGHWTAYLTDANPESAALDAEGIFNKKLEGD